MPTFGSTARDPVEKPWVKTDRLFPRESRRSIWILLYKKHKTKRLRHCAAHYLHALDRQFQSGSTISLAWSRCLRVRLFLSALSGHQRKPIPVSVPSSTMLQTRTGKAIFVGWLAWLAPAPSQIWKRCAMNQPTVAVLAEALEDEYKARATYRRVIAAFGPVQPFVNIEASEGRHIAALIALYERYGLEPPADEWEGRIEAPASVTAACEAAIRGEEENAAMYERLLAVVDEPDVRVVLLRLRSASQERHLPAFRRCAERGDVAGGGRGPNRRRRRRASG